MEKEKIEPPLGGSHFGYKPLFKGKVRIRKESAKGTKDGPRERRQRTLLERKGEVKRYSTRKKRKNTEKEKEDVTVEKREHT